MAKKEWETRLPAPFLKRVWLEHEKVREREDYPFCLPIFRDGFDLTFNSPITIIVGENGTGKSTILEGIARMAGYDDAGGGQGYRPVDHSRAIEATGGQLGPWLRGSWLPKVTRGWFFRAETFFSVARYLDEVGSRQADFLSHSHGEGFLRFFQERCQRQGIFIFDEPESALSPSRQIEFLKLLRAMDESKKSQVIMATHSPMLMAYPGAALMRFTPAGLAPTTLEETDHYRVMREFILDPSGFVEAHLWE